MSVKNVPIQDEFPFQLNIKDRITAATLAGLSPTKGDRYILTDGANVNKIARYNSSTWDYLTPLEGWFSWVDDEDVYYRFDGTNWAIFESSVGTTGANGTTGAEGTSYTWRGTWDSGTSYVENDCVYYNGSGYVCIQDGINKNPESETTYWEIFVEKGSTGTTGAAPSTIYSKSFVLSNPTSSSDGPIWRTSVAITITAIHVLCVDGINIVGQLDELDGNGLNAVAVDDDITGTAGTNVNDDGSLTNPGIDAGDYVGWHTTSVSGAVTKVIVTFEYTSV
jgi:hypothetical protein